MSERKRITVDAAIAAALRRLATGELGGYQEHSNGDISFDIDEEVAARIDHERKPGEDDAAVVRRMIKENTDISLPPARPN